MRPLTTKEWVDNWKTTGEWLERVAVKEMRALDEDATLRQKEMRAIFQMSDWICRREPVEPTSGLIEQQRYFSRACTT
ncbi:hypothetical protein FACS1894139_11290 [Planctomycetales bacterium]|nr:hypothetical protein FACS1894107_09760 [Planctomycetales bacterium]GHS98372.1 hypothetical protein FACS1894108_06410 [Planctomycetales bacterium]GHT06134.1 hypothetical protein FACS1894139_11290 [Planctomycetales bacterium]GHV20798.1 hypothetical protein AGMMS49959_08860 [Planctomycetales bacterium]